MISWALNVQDLLRKFDLDALMRRRGSIKGLDFRRYSRVNNRAGHELLGVRNDDDPQVHKLACLDLAVNHNIDGMTGVQVFTQSLREGGRWTSRDMGVFGIRIALRNVTDLVQIAGVRSRGGSALLLHRGGFGFCVIGHRCLFGSVWWIRRWGE